MGNKFLKLLFFFATNILLSKKEAHSQNYNEYLFTQYDLSYGLPSLAAGNLYKDNYGFLWISNAYGISFYNGKEFSNISQYNADKNFYFGDFPHNFLQIDKERLLITCSSGLYIFYYKTREVKKLPIDLSKSAEHHIRIIGFNKSHTEVIIKIDREIYIMAQSMTIKKIIHCTNESNTASLRNEYTLPFVFFYTNNNNLAYVNIENNTIDSFSIKLNPNGIVVNGQYKDVITIGNSDKIIQLELNKKKIISTAKLPLGQSKSIFFANSLKLDKNNIFWLAGESNLVLYNPQTNEVEIMNGSINHFNTRQINTNAIADLWIDSSSIFIGTFNAGLLEYNEALNRFKDYYVADPTFSNTMYNTLVNNDKVLGANISRGIYEFPISGNGKDYTFHSISKRMDPILQIEYLNKDYLWALYQEDFKLEIIARKNLLYKHVQLEIDELTKKYFFAINGRSSIQHSRPNLRYYNENCTYITIGAKLFSINNNNNVFKCTFVDSINTAVNISCICNSPQKKLVVSSCKGALYLLSAGKLVQKTANINNIFITVKSIDVDSTGKTYVITSNGLYIYNNDFSLYKVVTNASLGLLSDKLFAGRIDQNQVLWMSTNNGLIAYDTRLDHLTNFSSQNLMRNTQFFSKSMSADEKGNIYFGGSGGITGVQTNQSLNDLKKGQLYFDEIRIGNKLIHSSLIPEPINEDIPLAYNNNSLSFSFRAISYKQAATVYYKYKLVGFDTSWNPISRDKTISFLSLAPGSYKLIIKEYFPHKESGAEITYAFKIKKPFWTASLFIVLATLAISSLVVLGTIIFVRRKMEKQRIKSSLDIALKNERERISQDLHDELGTGLTSIRLLAKTILVKESNQNNTSENILRNMSKISGEMIDQMSEIVWVLNNSDGTFSNLLAHVRFYIADFIMRTQVPLKLNIENNIADDFQLTNTQRRNILLVIKEAFNNIIKHAQATMITIKSEETNYGIKIIITDNGIGLPEKKSPKGNGLNNMQKRIGAIGGKITFETNGGTILTIDIPK